MSQLSQAQVAKRQEFLARIQRSASLAFVAVCLAVQFLYGYSQLSWVTLIASLGLATKPTFTPLRYILAILFLSQSVVFHSQQGEMNLSLETLSCLALLCLFRETPLIAIGAVGLAVYDLINMASQATLSGSESMLATAFIAGISWLSNRQMLSEVDRSAKEVEDERAAIQKSINKQVLDQELDNAQLQMIRSSLNEMASVFQSDLRNLREAADQRIYLNDSIDRAVRNLSLQLSDLKTFNDRLANLIATSTASSQTLRSASLVLSQNVSELLDHQKATSAKGEDFLSHFESASQLLNKIDPSIVDLGILANDSQVLSINISIESELAGEYGQGFRVIARELRRLTTNTNQQIDEFRAALTAVAEDLDRAKQEIGNLKSSLVNSEAAFVELGRRSQSLLETFDSMCDALQTFLATLQTQQKLLDHLVQSGDAILKQNMQQTSLSLNLKAHLDLWERDPIA
jgi:methyl-accepting chemotaxis protein